MRVGQLAEKADLEVKAAAGSLDAEVTGGYAGDLLSGVIANAREGDVWVTWHVHPNVIAVAVVAKVAAVVLANGRQPEEETVRKAEQEGIALLVSKAPAFELIGRLYEMGITGV